MFLFKFIDECIQSFETILDDVTTIVATIFEEDEIRNILSNQEKIAKHMLSLQTKFEMSKKKSNEQEKILALFEFGNIIPIIQKLKAFRIKYLTLFKGSYDTLSAIQCRLEFLSIYFGENFSEIINQEETQEIFGLSEVLDEFFSFLQDKATLELFEGSIGSSLAVAVNDVKNLMVKSDKAMQTLLLKLSTSISSAVQFEVHRLAQQKGLLKECRSAEDYLKIFSSNKELKNIFEYLTSDEKTRKHFHDDSSYRSVIAEIFDAQNEFLKMAKDVNDISLDGVKRLCYLQQRLVPGTNINGGFCQASIAWLALEPVEKMQSVKTDGELSFDYNLHQVHFDSRRFCDLQSAQKSIFALCRGEIIYVLASGNAREKSQKGIDNLLNQAILLLEKYNYTVSILLEKMMDSKESKENEETMSLLNHGVGLKMIGTGNSKKYIFVDANQGVFLFDNIEQIKIWFSAYCAILGYDKKYDGFSLRLCVPKVEYEKVLKIVESLDDVYRFSIISKLYEYALRNFLPEKEKTADDIIIDQMIKLEENSDDNDFEINNQLLELYQKLKSPGPMEKYMALTACFNCLEVCFNNKVGYHKYINVFNKIKKELENDKVVSFNCQMVILELLIAYVLLTVDKSKDMAESFMRSSSERVRGSKEIDYLSSDDMSKCQNIFKEFEKLLPEITDENLENERISFIEKFLGDNSFIKDSIGTYLLKQERDGRREFVKETAAYMADSCSDKKVFCDTENKIKAEGICDSIFFSQTALLMASGKNSKMEKTVDQVEVIFESLSLNSDSESASTEKKLVVKAKDL